MADPRINLKNPWLAALLGFLLPGAGHLYQGRYFKGAVFLVCITGTFLYGMALGEWRPVYWTENAGRVKFGRPAKKNFGFLAQAGMGTPALYAYLQSRRYHSNANAPTIINFTEGESHELTKDELSRSIPLRETIDAEFTGRVRIEEAEGEGAIVSRIYETRGRLKLEPLNQSFRGTFEGTYKDSEGKTQEISLPLGSTLFLDSRVLGSPRRSVVADVINDGIGPKRITGFIPRATFHWFSAPQDDMGLQDLNRRLNKQFEMALLFTWIAGLLNVLAIWDAAQGPAYGYGDESPEDDEQSESKSSDGSTKTKADDKQATPATSTPPVAASKGTSA